MTKQVTKSDHELLNQLAEIEGFDDSMDLLEAFVADSVVPGICPCGYSNHVEPDQTEGWCEECQKGSVKSALILAGII